MRWEARDKLGTSLTRSEALAREIGRILDRQDRRYISRCNWAEHGATFRFGGSRIRPAFAFGACLSPIFLFRAFRSSVFNRSGVQPMKPRRQTPRPLPLIPKWPGDHGTNHAASTMPWCSTCWQVCRKPGASNISWSRTAWCSHRAEWHFLTRHQPGHVHGSAARRPSPRWWRSLSVRQIFHDAAKSSRQQTIPRWSSDHRIRGPRIGRRGHRRKARGTLHGLAPRLIPDQQQED